MNKKVFLGVLIRVRITKFIWGYSRESGSSHSGNVFLILFALARVCSCAKACICSFSRTATHLSPHRAISPPSFLLPPPPFFLFPLSLSSLLPSVSPLLLPSPLSLPPSFRPPYLPPSPFPTSPSLPPSPSPLCSLRPDNARDL